MGQVQCVRIQVQNCPVDLTQMLSPKRIPRCIQLVKDRGGAEKIGSAIDRFALYLLGRQVWFVGEFLDRSLRQQVFVAEQPEVQDFQTTVGKHLDVGRVEKMMKYTLLVGIVQRGAKLLGHGKNFCQFGRARAQQFLKTLALDKLGSHKDSKPFVTTGIKASDGRVVQ